MYQGISGVAVQLVVTRTVGGVDSQEVTDVAQGAALEVSPNTPAKLRVSAQDGGQNQSCSYKDKNQDLLGTKNNKVRWV